MIDNSSKDTTHVLRVGQNPWTLHVSGLMSLLAGMYSSVAAT
jgi:hypothetical protein